MMLSTIAFNFYCGDGVCVCVRSMFTPPNLPITPKIFSESILVSLIIGRIFSSVPNSIRVLYYYCFLLLYFHLSPLISGLTHLRCRQSKLSIYPISVHKISERKSNESENKNDENDEDNSGTEKYKINERRLLLLLLLLELRRRRCRACENSCVHSIHRSWTLLEY